MESEAPGRSRGVLAIGVFVLAFGFHASYAFHGLPLYDGGILIDGADRILRGDVFARDFFAPYGPARYYVLAGWFLLCGPSLAAYVWLVVAIQAGANAALFLLAARSTTLAGALLASLLLALAHGALHKSFLLVALLLGLGAAALPERVGDRRRCVAAGALAGCAFLFRYDVGVFALVALLASAAVEVRGGRCAWLRRALRLCAGWAAPVAASALLLLAAGASPAGWWQHSLQRVAVMQSIRMPFPWPWRVDAPPSASLGVLLLAFGVALAALVALGAGVVSRRLRGAPLAGEGLRAAVAVLGLLAMNQTRLLMGTNRLFQVGAPVYLALADLLARRGRGRVPQAALAVLALGALVWVHTSTRGLYPGSYTARIEGAAPLDLPRAGVLVRAQEVAVVTDLVAAIQQEVPEGGMLGVALRPQLLGFLANRRLALPYAEPAYYLQSERFQREAIAALDEGGARIFVRDTTPVAGFTLERDAPLLDGHLRRHYRLLRRFGPFEMLRRTSEGGVQSPPSST